jgi:hypothetical protein
VIRHILYLKFTLLVVLLTAQVHGQDQAKGLAQGKTVHSIDAGRLSDVLYDAVRAGLPGVSLRISGPDIGFAA